MKPDFSEFSYAYAVTREIEEVANNYLGASLGPPLIPSLQQERDLGYDVEIAAVRLTMFLQFKLGWHVSRPHTDSPTWWHVNAEHYRIEFPAGHHQLPSLQLLEQKVALRGHPTLVYYYAPGFHEATAFTVHYASSEVLTHSYGCRPGSVPADGARHHLVTAAHLPSPLMLSEPTRIENAASVDSLLGAIDRVAGEEARLGRGNDDVNLNDIEYTLRETCFDAGLADDRLVTELADASLVELIGAWSSLLGVFPMLWLVPTAAPGS